MTNETLRGRLRTTKEVELEKELNLPVGSEVSISITSVVPAAGEAAARFKNAAGSWKDIPEDFINRAYADRHVSTREDVVL